VRSAQLLSSLLAIFFTDDTKLILGEDDGLPGLSGLG
jgi:hypothetical protein